MVAIYARQSIDKKDSISIETQIDFCKRELSDDSEYKIFKDKGFSGKNTDRPEFKKLIKAVENNELTKIIVYRLDRISRSITDFANILELFEEHKVSFVSANEKFDTGTPVGRAMLYIIMVFAQLERETIAERIRDNYYARGKTGVWLGGPAPLGFDNKKIVFGNKKVATIEPNNDISIIKEIYDSYCNSDLALGAIAKTMLKKYGTMWNNIKLSRILHNPAYVKADVDVYDYYRSKKCIIINSVEEFKGIKGCNLYGKRDRGANKYRSHEELVLSIGMHDGIIDSKTWLMCQYKLENNKQIKNTGKGKHSWLTGFVKCGYCKYGMNVKTYKEIKYFNCTGRYSTNLCIDKTETHYVDEIENYVFDEMKTYVESFEDKHIPVSNEGSSAEVNELKIELHNIENQINDLINTLSSANSVLIKYVNEKIVGLDKKKIELLETISKKNIEPKSIELPDLTNWSNLDIEIKRMSAQKLISIVLVYNDAIEVVWKS